MFQKSYYIQQTQIQQRSPEESLKKMNKSWEESDCGTELDSRLLIKYIHPIDYSTNYYFK